MNSHAEKAGWCFIHGCHQDNCKKLHEGGCDPINHPSHYTDGGIETIDFIEAKGLNYNCGNATKYISRAGKKATAERSVDIAKALWYLERELNTLKGK